MGLGEGMQVTRIQAQKRSMGLLVLDLAPPQAIRQDAPPLWIRFFILKQMEANTLSNAAELDKKRGSLPLS